MGAASVACYDSVMPKRPSKTRQDFAQNAFRVVQEATGQAPKTPPPGERIDPTKNPAAIALGKLGGSKGGRARAAALTKKQRVEIAKKGAKARWK